MSDEPVKNNNPNYETRRQLQEKLLAEQAKYAALESRLAALETRPNQDIKTAIREDREEARSAALERELKAAYDQIEHLNRPQTPTGPGVHYKGWVQAKEDCWFPVGGVRHGPKDGGIPGEVFEVDMPD